MTSLEQQADAILRAAGSSLANYTMPGTRAAILAAVQAVRDEGAQQWQDISTAPKDGTWLLLFCPSGIDDRSYECSDAPNITIGRFGPADMQGAAWMSVEHHYEFWDYGGMTGAGTADYLVIVEPTKWQPLPKAPQP